MFSLQPLKLFPFDLSSPCISVQILYTFHFEDVTWKFRTVTMFANKNLDIGMFMFHKITHI